MRRIAGFVAASLVERMVERQAISEATSSHGGAPLARRREAYSVSSIHRHAPACSATWERKSTMVSPTPTAQARCAP